MNAEEGDKCCDVTQESSLINGKQGGRLFTNRILDAAERPREEERPDSVLIKSPVSHFEILAQPPGSLAPGRAGPRGCPGWKRAGGRHSQGRL